jgi:DNA-binding response OmpR family regulator
MAKILIVDDDHDLVETCKLVLERNGHAVSAAYSRPEGMTAMKAAAPDLLILDVMMDNPDDGFVMAQDLRRQGCKTPILMLTSISKVTGLEFGGDNDLLPVDAFMEKPIKPSVLVAKVAELLNVEG